MTKDTNKLSDSKKDNKQVTLRLNINMIILGLLSILIFVSLVQTFTLVNLLGKKQAPTTANGTSAPVNNSGGKSDLPAALKNIPQQVGGC